MTAPPTVLPFNCHPVPSHRHPIPSHRREQVSGLLLSTPVETVPILVTYSAVSGGIFFHAPPLATSPAAASPSSREEHNGGQQPETTAVTPGRRRALETPVPANEEKAADTEEVEAAAAAAVTYLDNAFPGKLTVAPVSLRSTATWEGRVEGMESSGPLVRATLTRTDVPGLAGIAERGGGVGRGGGDPSLPGAEAGFSGAVQVRVCRLLEVETLAGYRYSTRHGLPCAASSRSA